MRRSSLSSPTRLWKSERRRGGQATFGGRSRARARRTALPCSFSIERRGDPLHRHFRHAAPRSRRGGRFDGDHQGRGSHLQRAPGRGVASNYRPPSPSRISLDGGRGFPAPDHERVAGSRRLGAPEPPNSLQASEPFAVPLGTLDAMHLATALVWQDRTGQKAALATHDRSLGLAARSFGMTVIGC